MKSQTIVRVLTTDPAALVDLPHFCTEAGHQYLGNLEEQDAIVHFLRKA